jgi:hypothetical protein
MAEFQVFTTGGKFDVTDVSTVDVIADDGMIYFTKEPADPAAKRLLRAAFPVVAVNAILLTKPDATPDEIAAL